jgi:GntR family transcriptional repressor for pyruvate dehydrogenase complex
MPIKPLEKKNLAVQLCEKIQEYILENNLVPGDKLPSEKELLAGFGVSRGSVREALKALEILGIVESKAGEGTFISEFSNQPLLMQMIFNASLNATKMEDLAEIRFLLEKGVVELVIERATVADINTLEELVVQIDSRLRKEPKEDINKLDLEFHRKLVQATQNPALAQMSYLWAAFFHRIGLIKDAISTSEYYRYAGTHGPLLEAIKRKDREKAKYWIKEHLKFWLEGEFRGTNELKSLFTPIKGGFNDG